MLLTFRFIAFRFERISSTVDSLLFVQESEIARPRDRFQNAENRRQEMKMMSFNTDTQMKNTQMKNTQMKKISATAKERAFENSTLRQFSQFERVLIETTTSNEMNTKTALTVHRADSVSDRKRDRKREREREREERERERRDREQAVSK